MKIDRIYRNSLIKIYPQLNGKIISRKCRMKRLGLSYRLIIHP